VESCVCDDNWSVHVASGAHCTDAPTTRFAKRLIQQYPTTDRPTTKRRFLRSITGAAT